MISGEKQWDLIIQPKRNFFDLRLKELWIYRDLILLFVWRDFVAVYKQTILGPLWYLIQPHHPHLYSYLWQYCQTAHRWLAAVPLLYVWDNYLDLFCGLFEQNF
jgi:hypothetical protein